MMDDVELISIIIDVKILIIVVNYATKLMVLINGKYE